MIRRPAARRRPAAAAALGLATAMALGLVAAAAPAGASPVELVHLEANVGGASGGHTALRVGGDAWHLEVGGDRRLALRREPWEAFGFRYNVLQNRPLHLLPLPVEPGEAAALRDLLVARRLEQLRAWDALARLRADAALLDAWDGTVPHVALPGVGLLAPARPADPAGLRLRAAVEARLGPGALARRVEALEALLVRPPGDAPGPGNQPPGAGDAVLARHRERLLLHAALVAVRDAHGLHPGARRVAAGLAPLDARLRAGAAGHAERAAARVAELVAATRPDRGHAILVASARHHALDASARGGRLVFVDAFPSDARRLDAEAVRARREELDAVADTLERRLAAALPALGDPDASPAALRRLESLANRAREARRGAREGRAVREQDGAMLPSRAGRVALPGPPPPDAPARRARLAAALRAAEADLDVRWRYHLVRANCVTALAELLAEGLGDAAAARAVPRPGAEGSPLAFVPFVFFEEVAARLGEAAAPRRIDAYRRRALAELAATRPDAAARLREDVAPAARLYRPRRADGAFLLFSDGSAAARPLVGLVNLAWGLGHGVLGLASAPFDGGARLAEAGRGLLFSVPELAFVNIRKGSYDAGTLRRAERRLRTAGAPPQPADADAHR